MSAHPFPFHDAVAVTPSDTADNRFAALYVNAAATDTVAIMPASGGPAVTFTFSTAGGYYIWCGTLKVLATGTAGAPEIIGLR